MVSSAKFKTLMLGFKEFFDYLNGFRDAMMLDYLYDFKIDGTNITIQYVNKDKIIEIPLKFATMKQTFEDWKKVKENDKTTPYERIH